ncbi:MAG: ABC transporter permease [Desulfobacterota bacterium]|nr:ABC transporter permease [Thermodesulfobacteriota bacterium]
MDASEQRGPTTAGLSVTSPTAEALLVRLSGDWKLTATLPSTSEVEKSLESGQGIRRVAFDARELGAWDSGLLTFLIKIFETCSKAEIEVAKDGLPEGVRRLIDLATAVPERKGARKEAKKEAFFSMVGGKAVAFYRSFLDIMEFLGESSLALMRLVRGKAAFRRSDLTLLLQECGAQALPIVSLISLLVGLILAFVGAIQLKLFGAQVYVADIVAIAMVRVMGAIMTGIIMAGRTGAAFAAQIGTMQVNEEIDALETMGISPVEFLVLPRMIALIIMMPLLCLYADLMGIAGGLIVGVGMLDIGFVEYLTRTQETLTLTTVWIGLFHSAVFGVLVALAGCLRGMQCGRSASDVGYAATSAVVTSIVSIIVATAIITFMCEVLKL